MSQFCKALLTVSVFCTSAYVNAAGMAGMAPSVSVQMVDAHSIQIDITDNSQDAQCFWVCRSNDLGQSWEQIYYGSQTSILDTNLYDGYYYTYQVVEFGANYYDDTAYSMPVELPLIPPSNLTVTPCNGYNYTNGSNYVYLYLNWSNDSWQSMYNTINIQCSTDGGNNYSLIGNAYESNYYADYNAASIGQYTYRIFASDYAMSSDYSNVASFGIVGPTNLMTSATLAGITLSWFNTGTGASYNIVERSDNGGSFNQIATDLFYGSSGALQWTDASASFPVNYNYRVSFNGIYTDTVSAVPVDQNPPTNVSVYYSGTGLSADVFYSFVNAQQNYFLIERFDSSTGYWTNIGSLSAPPSNWESPFVDNNLIEGTQCKYHVIAVLSGSVQEIPVETDYIYVQPAAPSSLVSQLGEGLVALTWTNVSNNYDSITLNRLNPSNSESVNVSLGYGSTSYNDTNVVFGQTYIYSVYAVSHGVTSDASNAVAGSPLTAPFVFKLGDTMTGALQINGTGIGLTVANNSAFQGNVTVGGNVNIGALTQNAILQVNGNIKCKDLMITLDGWQGWPDYVFDPNYKLADLKTVEAQIKKDRHLSGIPSAEEIGKKGISVPEMASKQLEKIEELTLYMIRMQKQQDELAQMCAELKKENKALKERLEAMSKK